MTKAQFRDMLKQAFEAGFAAARPGHVKAAWEHADIRKDFDYHGLYERLEEHAKYLPSEASAAVRPPEQA